ncbi:MAG: hypothetical protein J7521_15460 [Caulobacter sp.]|nr:hypothetical protein [Caulobacter sp.]
MTSLERPLPLPLVVVILAALSVAGFAFGLKNALDDDSRDKAAPTQPLAEVSGVPVRDAQPTIEIASPPPPPPAPKPKPVETVEEAPAAAPVVETPPAPPPAEKKPEPPPTTPPQRIEDLY